MKILEVKQFMESLDEENLLNFRSIVERQIEILELRRKLSNLSGGYVIKEFKK